MTWRDYGPNDPEGLKPFVDYLVQETFVKPLKAEVTGKPFETFDEAYDRVMKELKEHLESFQTSNKSSDKK